MATVTLYGKAGCHLCDDAEDILRAARADLDFDLVTIDIAGDPALLARYGQRIPVVAVGETVVSEFDIDLDRLRAALADV